MTFGEDKLRLTLKEQSELKASGTKFWTFLSFSLAFVIPLFTSTVNGFWILSAELLQAIFIVVTILFFVLTFVEAVKVLKGKITGGGDDDWFVLRVQDLEKPKKESSVGEAIVDFFCFTSKASLFEHDTYIVCVVGLFRMRIWTVITNGAANLIV